MDLHNLFKLAISLKNILKKIKSPTLENKKIKSK